MGVETSCHGDITTTLCFVPTSPLQPFFHCLPQSSPTVSIPLYRTRSRVGRTEYCMKHSYVVNLRSSVLTVVTVTLHIFLLSLYVYSQTIVNFCLHLQICRVAFKTLLLYRNKKETSEYSNKLSSFEYTTTIIAVITFCFFHFSLLSDYRSFVMSPHFLAKLPARFVSKMQRTF